MTHRKQAKHSEEGGRARVLRKGLALLLTAAMMLSMLPVSALAADGDKIVPLTREIPVEQPIVSAEDDRVSFDEDTLARLRAGELTKAEVDALIEQGLTAEDLQDPYAIAPMAITTNYEHVDPGYFKFVVYRPEDPLDFETYGGDNGLTSVYTYLPGTWAGPVNKAQVNEEDEYFQSMNDGPIAGGVKPGFVNNYDKEVLDAFANGSGTLGSDLENLYYPHLYGKVNGIEYKVARLSYHNTTVKRIGHVIINTSDAGMLTYVYVSSGVNTGSTSHFVIPYDEDGSVKSENKILVEYEPREFKITYEVYLDGELQDQEDPVFGRHAIFGAARANETVEQVASATVTLPEGYYARVYIGDKSEADKKNEKTFPTSYITYADSTSGGNNNGTPGVTSDYEKFPVEEGYGQFPLGMGPSFKAAGGTNGVEGYDSVVLDDGAADTPGFFTLSAIYISGEKGEADADTVIRVVLSKRLNFTISNELWGKSQTDGLEQQQKIKGNLLGGERTIFMKKDSSGKYVLDEDMYGSPDHIKPSTGQPYVEPEGVTIHDDGTYDFTWSFTTKSYNGEDFELRTLSINGESVDVPFVDKPSAGNVYTDKTVGPVQIQNATVEVTVTVVDTNTPDYANDPTRWGSRYQRRYDVKFTNVSRNLVITTSAMCPQSHYSFVINGLNGVDLQLWRYGISGYAWTDAVQGQVLHVGGNDFIWTSRSPAVPVGSDGRPLTGKYLNEDIASQQPDKYNARFKVLPGYELFDPENFVVKDDGAGGPPSGEEDEKDDTEVEGVIYTTEIGEPQNLNAIAGPDKDGWYYLYLSGTPDDTYNLSVSARLQQYQVKYLDGVKGGTSLQAFVDGLPAFESIENFPDFSDWNGLDPEDATVDNNGGKYYDLVSNNTIRISANIPVDTAERPAVFKFWVLSMNDGTPVNDDKEPYLGYDKTGSEGKDLTFTKGDTLKQLSDVSGAAYQDPETKIYTFYLTSYWTPAAGAFVYYIAFYKTAEDGWERYDVYYPDQKYPMRDRNGGFIGRYAAVDRRAYGKVDSTTVVFDPDSSLVAEYKATDPWYEINEKRSKDFVFAGITNYDILPIWYDYTLGGLTVKNTVEENELNPGFVYNVSFTLPEDNEGTAGDETLFFDQGFQSYVNEILSSKRDDGSTSVSYDAETVQSKLTNAYGIGYKDQSGRTGTVTLNKRDGRTYTGTFTLRHGESIIFNDLPKGTTYSVTEVGAPGTGYSFEKAEKSTKTRPSGTSNPQTLNNSTVSGAIAALTDDTVQYTNRPGTALELKQAVNGGEATTADVYVKPGDVITYTVTAANLTDHVITTTVADTLPESLQYVTGSADNGGTYAGGTITWENISLQPAGQSGASQSLTFRATVTADRAQTVKITNAAYEGEGDELNDESFRFYSNEVNADYAPVDLTVSKTVSGKGGESGKDFSFTVSLSDRDINGPYGDMTFTSGTTSFTLKGGEHKTAENLPSGITYTVVETDAGTDGYTTTVTDGNARGTLEKENVTVAFENKRPEPASVSLTGTKTLTVEDSEDAVNVSLAAGGEFKFIIQPQQGVGASGSGPVQDKDREGSGEIIRIVPNDVGTGSPASGGEAGHFTANITFLSENDKYTMPGTYVYTVREDLPSNIPAGYLYDSTIYTVTVTVSEPANLSPEDRAAANYSLTATYKIESAGSTKEAITFDNNYNADVVTANARAKKVYNGALQGGEFTLEIDAVEAKKPGGEPITPIPLPGGQTGSVTTVNGAGGAFQFPAFAFVDQGTYVYKFSEHDDSGTHPKIVYDKTVYYCVVEVTENGYSAKYYTEDDYNGSKEHPLTVEDVIFTNTVKNDLTVTNTLTGGIAKAEDGQKDFHFTVLLSDNTINGQYGEMEFASGAASFTLKNGEHKTAENLPVGITYTVTETEANQNGYTTLVSGTNSAVATGSVTEGDDAVQVTFVNRKASGATLSEEQKQKFFKGEKISYNTSEGDSPMPIDHEFSFYIVPGASNPAGDPIKALESGTRRTVKNATTETELSVEIDFTSWLDLAAGFADIGTYTYTLGEVEGNDPGHRYDRTVYTVKVVVNDSNADGDSLTVESVTLTSSAAQSPEKISFVNYYDPAPATIDETEGERDNSLLAFKTLTGGTLTDNLFTFFITADNNNPEGGGPIGVDPETGGKRKTVQNTADGRINLFGGGTFKKVGEYNYTITEMDRAAPGYTYDHTSHTVKVQVTDNHATGKLEATVVSVDGIAGNHSITFNNTYYAPTNVTEGEKGSGDSETSLVVETTLTGATIRAGQFNISVTPVANNPAADPIKETKYVTNAVNGSVKLFDGVTFTQPGVYKYTVAQVIPANVPAGYTYDQTPYTVTVTVEQTMVNGKGQLVATTSVTGPKGDTGNSIVFENKYESSAVTVTEGEGSLNAVKTLNGGDLTANQFHFTVSPAADNPEGDPITSDRPATNDANGSIKLFGGVYFGTEGVYKYTVKEDNDHVSGYTYDESVYTVTVSVTNANGQLTASTSVTKDGADTDNNIAFVNSYSAGSASSATVKEGAGGLQATKTLTGGTLSANQFSFTVTPDQSNPAGDPISAVRTVKNARDGSIRLFNGVKFAAANTYKYTVKEVDGKARGYTYDTSVYTVTVSVTDDGAGQLTAATIVTKNGADTGNKIVFENSYTGGGTVTPPNPPNPPAPTCGCPNCDPAKCTCAGGCSDGNCSCEGCKSDPILDQCDGGANCPSRKFTDLNPTAWYHKATDYVIVKNLMSGTSTTEFSPNATLTRAMLVTILWRSAGSPKSTLGSNPFQDVPTNQYYYQAVMWAYENNVVAGTTSTTFTPNSPITREQLAAILWRYAGNPGTAGSFVGFTDSNKISLYAEIPMRWVLEKGIMSGKGNGILDPTGKSTRAEAASMLMRYLEREPEKKS